jgi:catecholate siderophore receptor
MTTENTKSLRLVAAANSIDRVAVCGRPFLFAASAIALLVAGTMHGAAQAITEAKPDTELPAINVTAPPEARRSSGAPVRNAGAGAARHRAQPVRQAQPSAPKPFLPSQDARTGTVGYYTDSTSAATKTNTQLVNIPQSLTVISKEFIRDQSFQNLTDVTRYVPGVSVHQGEGNRDELVIRGVDSSANFYVNGFRDDVQYFRDVYNVQSIEILKGPSAIVFGRASGGGLVNRTLKEADGNRIYEATAQTGSWGDRRVTLDAAQAINQNVAARLNVFYEGSDAFRDFNHLERYGINPTVTLKPDDATVVKLSYEYFHDDRTSDRGNPSQALPGPLPGNATATRFNPTQPFAPNGDYSTFFGSPSLNKAIATVQTGMAIIDHDFGDGLTVRNGTIVADYKKFYQNVYPTGGMYNGGVDPTDTFFNLGAYNHTTNRDNVFNQTDFLYKTPFAGMFHTMGFGTEFGRQTGVDIRNTGVFPNGTPSGINTITMNPFAPTYFGPVTFVHHFVNNATAPDGVTAADANSRYALNITSGYVRDQVDILHGLQFIAAARYDRFDMSALDMNTGINRGRVDNLVSPAAAIIVKPVDYVSIYTAYSISYLPSTGDQFSALNDGTLVLQPQRFDSKEVGLKWNINPKFLLQSAVYQLDRTNQPVPVPGAAPGSGLAFPNGASITRGFEISLNGYVTDRWQSQLGYAYTDARIANNLTATTVALPILSGNRVQLVPFNQFAWWNKYQITEMWSAGLGIIHFGDSFATSDDTVRLPSFWRFDAGIYARIDENWKAQLTVENIFNRGYWASADGDNNISPGQGRTARLKAIYKF